MTTRLRRQIRTGGTLNTSEIKKAISDIGYYNVESLRAMAGIADQIRQVKDVETRKELTRLFEAQHGRRVSVWSRIVQRFEDVLPEIKTVDGLLALSYMCQLPEDKCLELYAAHFEHLDEPLVHLLVLRDVNDNKPHRAPKADTLAERMAGLYRRAQSSDYFSKEKMLDELLADKDVAAVLSRKSG